MAEMMRSLSGPLREHAVEHSPDRFIVRGAVAFGTEVPVLLHVLNAEDAAEAGPAPVIYPGDGDVAIGRGKCTPGAVNELVPAPRSPRLLAGEGGEVNLPALHREHCPVDGNVHTLCLTRPLAGEEARQDPRSQ